MSELRQSRNAFIAETKKFIEEECAQIGGLMAQLSWTPDHILKTHPMAQCPHSPSHFLPEMTLKKHAHACALRKRGCSKEDLALQLQDDDFFYEKAELVGKVKLDEGLLNSIIWNHCMENGQVYTGHRPLPVTSEDAHIHLLREERLAVYDYCVQQLKAQNKMANVEKDEVLTTDWEKIIKKGLLDEGGDKPKTEAELMAMLRDQKRRRQSYRAKNVHITKKSYTEIIREVIRNQMEILMGPEGNDNRPTEGDVQPEGTYSKGDQSPSYSRRSTNSQMRSRSRSPQRRRDRDISRGDSRSSDRSYREYNNDRRGRREQQDYREREDRRHRDYRESKERYDDGKDYREKKERERRESKNNYQVKEEKADEQEDGDSVQRSERRFREEDYAGKDQRDARNRRFREEDHTDKLQKEFSDRGFIEENYSEKEERDREKDSRDLRLRETITSYKDGEGSSMRGVKTRHDSDISDSGDSNHTRRNSKSSKKKKKHKHKKRRSKHAHSDSESND